jgi:hypothetical protein
MLELIVLGQVPGTNIELTFSWILALSAILLTWLEVDLRLKLHKRLPKLKITDITL